MEEETIKILKTRYAKGEITKKEYLEMKDELNDEDADEDNDEKVKSISNNKSGSSAGKIIGFILFVGIILLVLYFLSTGALNSFTSSAVNNAGAIANPTVTVSGTVTTQGLGTHPVSVTFGSSTTSVNSDGYYSISLQNDNSYPVTVAWSGPGGVGSGTCTYGTLSLQSTSGSYSYAISC